MPDTGLVYNNADKSSGVEAVGAGVENVEVMGYHVLWCLIGIAI